MNRLFLVGRVLALSVVLGFSVFWTGCETTQSAGLNTNSPAATAPQPSVGNSTSTVFYRGDKITIELTDTGTTIPPLQQIVREDGTVTLPLNQSIVAANKTKGELEKEIHDLYVDKFYKRMTVNVKPEERSYFVTGEVKNPGQKAHTGRITALRAIGAAGDFTDFANRKKIEIIRADGSKIKMNGNDAVKDPAKDVPVYPNDTVYVHRRLF